MYYIYLYYIQNTTKCSMLLFITYIWNNNNNTKCTIVEAKKRFRWGVLVENMMSEGPNWFPLNPPPHLHQGHAPCGLLPATDWTQGGLLMQTYSRDTWDSSDQWHLLKDSLSAWLKLSWNLNSKTLPSQFASFSLTSSGVISALFEDSACLPWFSLPFFFTGISHPGIHFFLGGGQMFSISTSKSII